MKNIRRLEIDHQPPDGSGLLIAALSGIYDTALASTTALGCVTVGSNLFLSDTS